MITRYKTEVLLKRLEKYDEKYYNQITKEHPSQQWGYSMRAYHSNKTANPQEWKIKEKAEIIAEELKNRNISFNTTYLRLKHSAI